MRTEGRHGGASGDPDSEDGRVTRPPPAQVVRSGRGSASRPRPGLRVREPPGVAGSVLGPVQRSRCCCRCRPRSAVPCWRGPGGTPGECALGLRQVEGAPAGPRRDPEGSPRGPLPLPPAAHPGPPPRGAPSSISFLPCSRLPGSESAPAEPPRPVPGSPPSGSHSGPDAGLPGAPLPSLQGLPPPSSSPTASPLSEISTGHKRDPSFGSAGRFYRAGRRARHWVPPTPR